MVVTALGGLLEPMLLPCCACVHCNHALISLQFIFLEISPDELVNRTTTITSPTLDVVGVSLGVVFAVIALIAVMLVVVLMMCCVCMRRKERNISAVNMRYILQCSAASINVQIFFSLEGQTRSSNHYGKLLSLPVYISCGMHTMSI